MQRIRSDVVRFLHGACSEHDGEFLEVEDGNGFITLDHSVSYLGNRGPSHDGHSIYAPSCKTGHGKTAPPGVDRRTINRLVRL